jgi:hypothetical protein
VTEGNVILRERNFIPAKIVEMPLELPAECQKGVGGGDLRSSVLLSAASQKNNSNQHSPETAGESVPAQGES